MCENIYHCFVLNRQYEIYKMNKKLITILKNNYPNKSKLEKQKIEKLVKYYCDAVEYYKKKMNKKDWINVIPTYENQWKELDAFREIDRIIDYFRLKYDSTLKTFIKRENGYKKTIFDFDFCKCYTIYKNTYSHLIEIDFYYNTRKHFYYKTDYNHFDFEKYYNKKKYFRSYSIEIYDHALYDGSWG